MPFGQIFENKVNQNMNDGQPGRAPTEAEDFEMDVKKGHGFPQPEHEDAELHHKKDSPPRFSTLFAPTPAPAPQPPPREYVQEYYPRPEKKKGVFIPMPLFIVFAIILFFESTILFAYTVIGLYNNAPSRLFPWAGQGTAAAACDCGEHQPAINISPNFVLPQGGELATRPVTITISPTVSSSTTSSTTSSSSSTDAAAIASDVLGILGSLTTSSSSTSSPVATVTYTPPRSTVDVTTVITQGASETDAAPVVTPTVTLTTKIPPPSSITETTSSTSSYNSAAWASISSAIAANKSDLTADPVPSTTSTPTNFETSTTPASTTTEKSTTETSPVSSATGKVCFGGSGGVQLTCV